MKKIVIVGNGISGITAARHIRKMSKHPLTVISAESDYFYSRTALMYIYMGHMKYEHTKPYEDWFWQKNDINLIRDFVININTDQKALELEKGNPVPYDILIIATGSITNKFGWPGQDLKGVQGLYGLEDLANMEKYTRGIERAIVVGGGLVGIEVTEMLLSRKIPVTILIREEEYWDNVLPKEESAMVSGHILEHHGDLRKSTELKEILADENGRARAVVTKNGEEISCQFVVLTPGVSPNIEMVKQSKIETDKGVLVNKFFETNIPEVYAIGDCAQFRVAPEGRKNIEQVWYTGRIHGEILAYAICKEKTSYQPGVWFNSAKFMDIEYQVYGNVKNGPAENECHFYWEHSNGKISVRIVFNKDTRQVIGFNLMGIRFRHEVCERWIKNKTAIDEVMPHLKQANFDPEFFNQHEEEILAHYNHKFPGNAIQIKKRKKVFGIF